MAAALEGALREVDDLLARLKADFSTTSAPAQPLSGAGALKAPAAAPAKPAKQPKAEKKAKAKPAAAAAPAIDAGSPLAETFVKARLRVGRVLSVEPLPNSDKLYRTKVQVGAAEERQIIAGLRKHVSAEELQGRLVCVILNLKTAKLAGEASEGMILAAVQKGEQYANGELVKPIQPPAGAEAGDPIFLDGTQPLADGYPKEFKKWKQVLPALAVKAGNATFEGRRLLTAAGPVTADEAMPDGAAIS